MGAHVALRTREIKTARPFSEVEASAMQPHDTHCRRCPRVPPVTRLCERNGRVFHAPEHSGRSAISLSTPLVNQERNGIMSDPRYTDPRGNDQSRRYDVQGSNGAGRFWPWITAALTALGTLIGLLIGYNWADQRSAQLSPPATTGSAPSQPRPAPPGQVR